MDRLFLRCRPILVNEEQRRNRYIIFQIKTLRDYEKAQAYYKQYVNGQDVLLIQEPWQKKLTKKQNNYLHAIIHIIKRETDNPAALVKEAIKEKYYPRCDFLNIRIIKPTMMLTRKEMSRAIDGAIREAAELGINIDDYRQEWERWKQQNN